MAPSTLRAPSRPLGQRGVAAGHAGRARVVLVRALPLRQLDADRTRHVAERHAVRARCPAGDPASVGTRAGTRGRRRGEGSRGGGITSGARRGRRAARGHSGGASAHRGRRAFGRAVRGGSGERLGLVRVRVRVTKPNANPNPNPNPNPDPNPTPTSNPNPNPNLGGRVLLVLVLDVGLHADEDVGGEGARRREPRVEELACLG